MTQVLVNGTATQMFYASNGQVNFLAPASINGDTADIVVETSAGASTAYHSAVLPIAPGVFFDTATGNGAILIAGTAKTTAVRPAAVGEALEIYMTGMGPTALRDGYDQTLVTPQVSVAGVPAEVLYSGRAPGFPGLYQVNVLVPPGAPSGVQPLVVEMNGARSNEVKVRLQ